MKLILVVKLHLSGLVDLERQDHSDFAIKLHCPKAISRFVRVCRDFSHFLGRICHGDTA